MNLALIFTVLRTELLSTCVISAAAARTPHDSFLFSVLNFLKLRGKERKKEYEEAAESLTVFEVQKRMSDVFSSTFPPLSQLPLQ